MTTSREASFSPWAHAGTKEREDLEGNEVECIRTMVIRNKFLAVGGACVATTPGFKRKRRIWREMKLNGPGLWRLERKKLLAVGEACVATTPGFKRKRLACQVSLREKEEEEEETR